MTLLGTVLAFLVTLGVLIVIHELGHYGVARLCGVKVLRFSIGFGRPLFKAVRGPDRTEWVVAAIPLGGYVRMLDERDDDGGPVPVADLPRAFNRQSVWRRIAIVLAGPLANLLLAVVVYWALNVFGVMEPKAVVAQPAASTPAARAGLQRGDLIVAIDDEPVRSWNEVNWLILQHAVARRAVDLTVQRADGVTRLVKLDLSGMSKADLEGNPLPRVGLAVGGGVPQLGRIAAGSAAERAGLRTGDRVLEADGRAIGSASEFITIIRCAPERSIDFVVERDGRTFVIPVTPTLVQEPSTDDWGLIGAAWRKLFGKSATEDAKKGSKGQIGAVVEPLELVRVHYGPVEGMARAVVRTWDTIVFSLSMLGKMITGEASWKNLSGPITIADYAGKTASMGLVAFVSFLALVSISLGVLNLLPIPMLDGGHLLYYLVEIIKGSPPPDGVVEWGQRIGFGLLLSLTMLALYNDLQRSSPPTFPANCASPSIDSP
jgi:regulator of sigma E protease